MSDSNHSKKACCTPSAAAAPGALQSTHVSLPPNDACKKGQVTPMGSVIAENIMEAKTGSTAGMILLNGGKFQMGTEDEDAWASDGEGPGSTIKKRMEHPVVHVSYYNRYRVAARTSNSPDSATTNLGFRCARDA